MSISNAFDIASKELWADFDEERSFPATRLLLAHYTSIQTFERIIANREFWFSNPLYMNDLEELRFGMIEGAAEFRRSELLKKACESDGRHKHLVDAFDQHFNDFDKNHVLNTYLMCFSEHTADDNDGLLSMWRGYGNGGSGAAIVVDTNNINVNPGSPLIVGKVHYGTKEKRFAWIHQKIDLLAKIVTEHAKTTDDLSSVAYAWFHRLKSFALFSKHSGFQEEREWRIVYMSDRDNEKKLQPFFGHLATNRGIEPKLKLPIRKIEGVTADDLSLEKIIDRIILGPSIASVLGVNSLKQMLANLGHANLAARVVASEIPFRAT
ncbi:DUF2971 domain-containing protein [Rhodoferax sp. GW822-FHT02A01]|uniref:DUF2971 domain-containing protein n=1 Tax=Rhodoferax sp. GW822-FHT02A01 TaxID=3141537 RepID=UPI00315DD3DD